VVEATGDEEIGVAETRGVYRINRIAELLTGSE
jgi:hypothetical protein